MRLSYREEGQGRPLLLVHGFGIPYQIWCELLPLLRGHFQLVMPELPGVGGSPMPPPGQDYLAACVQGLVQLRIELGFEQWDVLGYSSGSRIAEAYIDADAAHVGSAAFLCPVRISRGRARTLRLALELDRRMPAFGSWMLRGWRLRFLIWWLGFGFARDPLCDEWYAEIGAVPAEVLKATVRAMMPAAPAPFDVPVPHVMIWGDHDVVPEKPRKPGPYDRFVNAGHDAPLRAAREVAVVLKENGER